MEPAQTTADELACEPLRVHTQHQRVSGGERYRHLKTRPEGEGEAESQQQTDRKTGAQRERHRGGDRQGHSALCFSLPALNHA